MIRARIASVAVALVAFFAFSATAALAEKRVALVIGNSAYKHTVKLKNPVRDAQAVAAALKRLGFDVIEGVDLDREGMRAKIRDFTAKMDGADVSLFYYAGHGFQIDGKNHLAPVDSRLSRESDVDFETIPLNLVLRQMERERRTNLVFLDACRDNPLAQQLARTMLGRSTAISRGLARVESGVGTLIGYSTSPGMVAYDGEGDHSPYTSALLKHIETPGLSINDMMISVRQDVLSESKGKQIPWEHSSLTGQYYFKDKVQVASVDPQSEKKDPVKVASSADTSTASARATVVQDYQATVAIGSCGAYRIFEEQHRNSFYGRLAEEYLRKNCAPSNTNRQIKVEEAGTPAPVKVAAASSTDKTTDDDKSDSGADAGALTVAIQQELDRHGCKPGSADGKWGTRTTAALTKFMQRSSLDLKSDGPSEEALAALKAKTSAICKDTGSEAVAAPVETAPAKKSTTKKAPTVKKKVVTKRPPPPRKAPPPRYKKKEYWGGEDTRFDCEARMIITDKCFR